MAFATFSPTFQHTSYFAVTTPVPPAPLPTVLEEDSMDDPTPMDIDPQPAYEQ